MLNFNKLDKNINKFLFPESQKYGLKILFLGIIIGIFLFHHQQRGMLR